MINKEYKNDYLKDKGQIYNKYSNQLISLVYKLSNNDRIYENERIRRLIDIIINKHIDVNLLYFLTKNTSSSIYTYKLLERIVEHGIKEYKQEIMLNNISNDFI